MDRYLYRAKRKNWRELPKEMWWVEGYLYGILERRYILWGMTNDVPNMVEVDPSTICQCTGLNDKNGKLIWENDIVKHDFGKDQIGVQLAIVKYDSKYACYQIKPIYDWMYCDKSDCEVIGNIFDNPELLEVGE